MTSGESPTYGHVVVMNHNNRLVYLFDWLIKILLEKKALMAWLWAGFIIEFIS